MTISAVYNLFEYDSKKDTINGVNRNQFLKQVEQKFNQYIAQPCCKEVYTNLPEKVEDWFGESGSIIIRMSEGYSITDETFPWELDSMLTTICNEDGIFLLLKTEEVWKLAEDNGCSFGIEDDDMRRLK